MIVECWNTFGDLGAAARSSNQKIRDEELRAVAIAGDGEPFGSAWCGSCAIRRQTAQLIARYPGIFQARLPGSTVGWLKTLTDRGPMPAQPGLIWCDVKATRLFARRRPGGRD